MFSSAVFILRTKNATHTGRVFWYNYNQIGNWKENHLNVDFEMLSGMELCRLLKCEDGAAWEYVLGKIVAQERLSAANNRKRHDWGVDLYDLLGRLYEDMVRNRRLDNFRGTGSLIGWMRSYFRGYLNRCNPEDGRHVDIDSSLTDDEGSEYGTLGDAVAFEMSEMRRRDAYDGEDLQVLRHERLESAERCFAELWRGNSMQAYVMLLKTRFHLSSAEIKDRLGISSAANVDQLFSRAVKKMRELRSKNEA